MAKPPIKTPRFGSGSLQSGLGGAPSAPERWRRTATIALAGAVLLGFVSFLPSSMSAVAIQALMLIGAGGGLVAGRWLDVVALVGGGAVGVILSGVIQSRLPGEPSSYGAILSAALPVGAITAIVAGVVFWVRRLSVGPQSCGTIAAGCATPNGAPRTTVWPGQRGQPSGT